MGGFNQHHSGSCYCVVNSLASASCLRLPEPYKQGSYFMELVPVLLYHTPSCSTLQTSSHTASRHSRQTPAPGPLYWCLSGVLLLCVCTWSFFHLLPVCSHTHHFMQASPLSLLTLLEQSTEDWPRGWISGSLSSTHLPL